ncbi:response regulator, partial [Vibrio parahaemolyticus]
LILLDLRLPDMTGMDVLHAVKKSHPDVPIIFMTAHGSQDFLIKPCEADRLRVTVNNAIRKATKLKNEADNP